METSDSENFESADEQFFSDSSDEITQVSEKKILKTCEDLNKLDISENKTENENKVRTTIEERKCQDVNTNILKSNQDNKQYVSKSENFIIEESKDVHITTVSTGSSDQSKDNLETKQTKNKRKFSDEGISQSKDFLIKEDLKPQNTDVFEGDGWDVDDEGANLWKDDEGANLWKDDEVQWSSNKDLKTDTNSKPTNTEDIPQSSKNDDIKKDTTDDSENMWENEEWEDFDNVQTNTKSVKTESDTSWTGWGNWGVSSILNTATQSVSTLTNQVSQGLSAVLETGIGIPNAEDLAKIHSDEEKQIKLGKFEIPQDVPTEKNSDSSFGFGNLGNLVSGVTNITKFVESTSTKVIAGGLDTLETIGKKTMEVLQEGDPGLKKKRAFLKLDQEKPILSQLLREAKEKAERESNVNQDHAKEVVRKMNYETLFDDHHGLVHLEALEMLSKQCEIKLKTLLDGSSDSDLTELQETMDQVKELCELPDEDEEEQFSTQQFREKLETALQDIRVNITYDRLLSTWEETEQWLNNLKLNICDEQELHQQAIETLAQLTALAVEQYHKSGELLLIKDHRSTADEADSLVQLTTALTSLMGVVAAKFSDKLNSKLAQGSLNQENINSLITNVFFEAANSSSYIQDAFQLLIPVIQIGAI